MERLLAMVTLFILVLTSGPFSHAAGNDHQERERERLQEQTKWETQYLDSDIQLMQDQVSAMQTKKSCLSSAQSRDDLNICNSKFAASEAEARVRQSERRKTIDSQRHH